MNRGTKAPWRWRRIGGDWYLFGDHGDRPVVLDCGTQLQVRDVKSKLLVPFSPDHPDALMIAAAPELADSCAELLAELDSVLLHGHTSADPSVVRNGARELLEIVGVLDQGTEAWAPATA